MVQASLSLGARGLALVGRITLMSSAYGVQAGVAALSAATAAQTTMRAKIGQATAGVVRRTTLLISNVGRMMNRGG